MRKTASFVLLFVFAVFLGIALFHPFSHGSLCESDSTHECAVCLWLLYAVIDVFFAISLSFFLLLVTRFTALVKVIFIKASYPVCISRAPPQTYS
jgi:hypothetical protein